MRHVVIALACCLLLAGCFARRNRSSTIRTDDVAFRRQAGPGRGVDRHAGQHAGARWPSAWRRRWPSSCSPTASSPRSSPAPAPLKITGAMSTRDAAMGTGIEIEIEWFVLGRGSSIEGPAISRTVTQPQDFAEASDRLVSRIAQQAAPRIATLMGKPPTFEARSPGQIAAGVNMPRAEVEGPVQPATAAATPGAPAPPPPLAPRRRRRQPAPGQGDGGAGRRARRRTATASSSPACAARSARARSWSIDAGGRRHLHRGRQGEADADRRQPGPARHHLGPEGSRRQGSGQGRAVQSRAAGRRARLLGGLRRHRRAGRGRRRSGAAREGAGKPR